MNVEICKLCGKEFTNLGSHIRSKHKISREEYDNSDTPTIENEFEEEEEGPISVTPDERIANVFKGSLPPEKDLSLRSFLTEVELTEKELRNVVRDYKSGEGIGVTQQLKRQTDQARKTAIRLSKQRDVRTTELLVAEILKNEHDYTVVDLKGKTANRPTTWILSKNIKSE